VKVFNFVFNIPSSAKKHAFDSDQYRDHFWKSRFATSSVQLINQERNNFASFVRTAVDLSLPLKKSDEELSDILSVIENSLDDENHLEIFLDMSGLDPYVVAASELYSAAFFGRQDTEAWQQRFLPIAATVTRYRRGTTPISKKSIACFWVAVRQLEKELEGKTVSTVIRIVQEALTRLIVIRHLLSTVFKDNIDALIVLLSHREAISAPDLSDGLQESVMTKSSKLKAHYIAPVTFKDRSKYTTSDIAYFVTLRDEIKVRDRLHDKKPRSTDNKDCTLMLAFVAPDESSNTAGLSSPSLASKRRRVSSPSGTTKAHSSAMELFSEGDNDDSDEVDVG
jgi:hypothetical protein